MAVFRGGEKMEAFLHDMAEKVSNPGVLRVGFLENSRYPDGTQTAMVAAIQDYGTDTIPSRPFFRNVIAAGEREWGDKLGRILQSVNYDATKALGLLGEMIKGEIKDSINNGDFAPLSPKTVAKKGFDKPLIDTAHMINSVDSEIR